MTKLHWAISYPHLPSERQVLHGLLWRLLGIVAYPGAALLQHYDLVMLVVDNLGIYYICAQFLKLSVNRNIPICLYLHCFIDSCSWVNAKEAQCLPGPDQIGSRRPLRLCHVLSCTLFKQVQGQYIRCKPCSLVLYPISFMLSHCSDSCPSCGWRTIRWVKAVALIWTYPPLYVMGMITTWLANKSIAQCLATHLLLLLLPTCLAIFGSLSPLSVLILALLSDDF